MSNTNEVTPADAPELITQAEHARRCGVSRKSVTVWKGRGLLEMQGDLIDFARSYKGENWHASVKAARREPPVRAASVGKAKPRPAPGAKQSPAVDPNQPTRMTVAEVCDRLAALDWAGAQDWAPAAQEHRARQAATCIGFEAVLSVTRDDGHWGGFQLREGPATAGTTTTTAEPDVIAGYGFELAPWQVLEECRSWLTTPFDEQGNPLRQPGEVVTVIPALLPALAMPLFHLDRKDTL